MPKKASSAAGEPVIFKGKKAWAVEEVIGSRRRKGTLQYLLKWEGYPVDESTWQDESSCYCTDLITAFYESKTAEKSTAKVDGKKKDAPKIIKAKITKKAKPPQGKTVANGSAGKSNGIVKSTKTMIVRSSQKQQNGLVHAHVGNQPQQQLPQSNCLLVRDAPPLMTWTMPRDGIYKIQLGLKVGTFLGFERNANCPGGVAFLTKYQNGEFEMVPTQVLANYAAKEVIAFYEKRLSINH